jgi:hypothetical protein
VTSSSGNNLDARRMAERIVVQTAGHPQVPRSADPDWNSPPVL